VEDHSRKALQAALAHRTQAFQKVPKTPQSYTQVAQTLRAEQKEPIFPAVKNCPLLGFLDEEESRVGCLAHPGHTGGIDLRICGEYTARFCEEHLCPSFGWLSDEEAQMVEAACNDWYLYGLVITDVTFVRTCLHLIEDSLCGPIDLPFCRSDIDITRSMGELFALKEDFQREGGKLGAFMADDSGEGSLGAVLYSQLDISPQKEDEIIGCLDCIPETQEDVTHLRQVIADRVQGVSQLIAQKRKEAL